MSLRILMMEKESATADLLVPCLERKQYEVVVADSVRQATSRIRAWQPDLLIVDVPSFGRRGYEVCETIRNKLAEVRTILLLEQGHAAAGSSADAFMTRPYSTRSLLHRVKKLAEGLVPHELCAGGLTFDPDSRILHNRDVSHYLRPKEATLLQLFMRNAGRVLSRREIMHHIWETDYIDDTRTLSVHIRWLREKIEQDPHRPRIIRTVRGVGYRFEIPSE